MKKNADSGNAGALKVFVPITKIDDEKQIFYGVMAEESVDKSGEIWDYETNKSNVQEWSDYFKKATGSTGQERSAGNLRSQHTNKSVGKLLDVQFDDTAKSIPVSGHVSDKEEWGAVKRGERTGLSIGGNYVKRWVDPATGKMRYTAKLSEVSLVDNPCMNGATFTAIKSDGSTELRKFVSKEWPPPKEGEPEDEEKKKPEDEGAEETGEETGGGPTEQEAEAAEEEKKTAEMAEKVTQVTIGKAQIGVLTRTPDGHKLAEKLAAGDVSLYGFSMEPDDTWDTVARDLGKRYDILEGVLVRLAKTVQSVCQKAGEHVWKGDGKACMCGAVSKSEDKKPEATPAPAPEPEVEKSAAVIQFEDADGNHAVKKSDLAGLTDAWGRVAKLAAPQRDELRKEIREAMDLALDASEQEEESPVTKQSDTLRKSVESISGYSTMKKFCDSVVDGFAAIEAGIEKLHQSTTSKLNAIKDSVSKAAARTAVDEIKKATDDEIAAMKKWREQHSSLLDRLAKTPAQFGSEPTKKSLGVGGSVGAGGGGDINDYAETVIQAAIKAAGPGANPTLIRTEVMAEVIKHTIPRR